MRVQTSGWEDPLEEGMAPHSSILAWRIPWTEEPDALQSMGSQRVGHDRATLLSTFMVNKNLNESFRNSVDIGLIKIWMGSGSEV